MEIVPENMKGRSLGERPAFLRSPPGCGVSKPWGVWEGGFDERLGGRRRAMSISLVSGALGCGKRCQFREKPFRYELQLGTTVSNGGNLTNERTVRHLQNCISGLGAKPSFAGFCCISVTADSRKRVGWNPDGTDRFGNFSFDSNPLTQA